MSEAHSTTVSDELEHWLGGDQPKTLGNIIELFGERSFALIFVLLMALPALPLPTAGATHVLKAVTMLVALQLVVGRRCIWLPARWKEARACRTLEAEAVDSGAAAHPLVRAILASPCRPAVRAPRHEERVRGIGARG